MATALGVSWAQLDEQIQSGKGVAQLVAGNAVKPPSAAFSSRSPGAPDEPAKSLLADWTRVLDSINEASARAGEREKRLASQSAAHQQALADLRAELLLAREESRSSATRAQAMVAEAEERVRSAKERARLAEARADHAEAWLARIAEAVGTLLVTGTSVAGGSGERPGGPRR